MFELKKNPPINKAELHKIIIDVRGKTVDIEYQVGYEEDGDFKSIGVDKLFLQDKEEVREESDVEGDGEIVVQEAITDYTDFIKAFATAKKPDTLALKELETHGIKK